MMRTLGWLVGDSRFDAMPVKKLSHLADGAANKVGPEYRLLLASRNIEGNHILVNWLVRGGNLGKAVGVGMIVFELVDAIFEA